VASLTLVASHGDVFAEEDGAAPGWGRGRGLQTRSKLEEMGCGGLLGVNCGSKQPPRMVRMAYTPRGSTTGVVAAAVLYVALMWRF
jgi:hypothetical protein